MQRLLLTLCLLTLVTTTAWVDDSAPTFHYNPQRTGLTPNIGPDEPALLWRFQTGASLFSSPVIANDGTLYLASTDGKLYALDQSGTMQWSFQAEEALFATPAIGPDNTIYLGDLAGNYYAISPDGNEKWRYQPNNGTDRRIIHAPVVDSSGQSYFGAWNERFYAIRPNGGLRWQTSNLRGYFSSAPVLDEDNNVYVACNQSGNAKIAKFAPQSSQPAWTFDESIRRGENRVISSPALDHERQRLYLGVCTDEGRLYAINIRNGNKIWSQEFSKGIISSPAIASDGTIYVGCLDGYVYAITPTNGTDKWKFKTDGYFVIGSPSVDGNGTIYCGDSDGILYALSPDGDELWRYQAQNGIESSPVIASDGTLYFTSTDSALYALKNPTAIKNWPTH